MSTNDNRVILERLRGAPAQSGGEADPHNPNISATAVMSLQPSPVAAGQPLPCPFCGASPHVYPKDPEIEGKDFAQVRCESEQCEVNPVVNAYMNTNRFRRHDTAEYRADAIRRWNKREPVAGVRTSAENDQLVQELIYDSQMRDDSR